MREIRGRMGAHLNMIMMTSTTFSNLSMTLNESSSEGGLAPPSGKSDGRLRGCKTIFCEMTVPGGSDEGPRHEMKFPIRQNRIP